jgi:biotin transport system substrate-specific component
MKAYPLRTEVLRSATTRKVALVLAGVGILAASAWLSVPFYPVPLTMQTLAVLLVGGMLGPVLGVSAVAGYLVLGAVGAPVFHNGLGGLLVLGGPTGGYLIGFLPAVFLMGWAARLAGPARPGHTGIRARATAGRRLVCLALGAVAASVAIYALGLPWLALVGHLSLERTIDVGLVPFLLGDALKAAVAVGAVYLGNRALSQWRPSLF